MSAKFPRGGGGGGSKPILSHPSNSSVIEFCTYDCPSVTRIVVLKDFAIKPVDIKIYRHGSRSPKIQDLVEKMWRVAPPPKKKKNTHTQKRAFYGIKTVNDTSGVVFEPLYMYSLFEVWLQPSG